MDELHRGAGFKEADAVTGELPSSSGGRSQAWGQSLGMLTKQATLPSGSPFPGAELTCLQTYHKLTDASDPRS